MTLAFAALAAAALVAAFVQGAVGMGFALIMGPVLALMAPALVPGGLLVMMLPLNLLVMLRERGALDWSGAGWITLGRAVGGVAGLAVVATISAAGLTIFVGVTTIAAAVATLEPDTAAITLHASVVATTSPPGTPLRMVDSAA